MTYEQLFAPENPTDWTLFAFLILVVIASFFVAVWLYEGTTMKRLIGAVASIAALFAAAIGALIQYTEVAAVELKNRQVIDERFEDHYGVSLVKGSVPTFSRKSIDFEIWDADRLHQVYLLSIGDEVVLMDDRSDSRFEPAGVVTEPEATK